MPALWITCVLAIGAAACRQPELSRGQAQAEAGGPVTIAAPWPWESRTTLLYGQGLQMAVDEVNAAGGVLGRPLTVLREDDHESVDRGRLVAQRLAQNNDVVAVIGHMQSYVSLPAAAIYDLSGLVHLAPTATDPRLTEQGYRRLFRMTFTDREIGAQMADFAAAQGYDRVAIYYIRNAYGRGLANAFEERALELAVGIADRQSYDPNTLAGERALTDILASWRDLDLRAIFIAGEPRQAAAMIRAARDSDIAVPVLGGDALGDVQLREPGRARRRGNRHRRRVSSGRRTRGRAAVQCGVSATIRCVARRVGGAGVRRRAVAGARNHASRECRSGRRGGGVAGDRRLARRHRADYVHR